MENTPFWIGSPSSRIEAAENSNKKHATRSNPLNLLVEASRTKRSYRNGYGVSGSETLVWRFLNSWQPLEGREREREAAVGKMSWSFERGGSEVVLYAVEWLGGFRSLGSEGEGLVRFDVSAANPNFDLNAW